MMKTQKFLMLLVVAGLIFGFAGCPNGSAEEAGEFDRYFEGSFRNNAAGTTEIVNNSASDMLLFRGATLSRGNIVGGVRAGTRANVNFSTEQNWAVGGWVLLRAVRVSEFEANGNLARTDHMVMAVFGEGRRFTSTIESATDGTFEIEVNNFDPNFALELRKNSAFNGEVIAFLTRGERNRVVRFDTNTTVTIFPVWVAIDRRTMTPITIENAGAFDSRTIAPVAPPAQRPHLHFPVNEAPVANPVMNVAGINVINNTAWFIRVGTAGQPTRVASGQDGINPGGRDSFEIAGQPGGLNLTITVPDGHNVVVPVRFAGETTFPVLQNGNMYSITFNMLTPTPSTNPDDWSAVLLNTGEVDLSVHIEAP